MPSRMIAEKGTFSIHRDRVEIVLKGMCFIGGIKHLLSCFVKAHKVYDFKCPFCELANLLAIDVVEIKMIIAILARLVDELLLVPRKELNGMQRLEVFIVALSKESAKFLTCCSIILIKRAVVLITIQFDKEE